MAAASDVPGKFDVVIDGKGYTFLRTLDGSYLTAGRHRAEYGYTPTFLERSNVGAAYGDNQQSFFLTASQNDWSLGQGQFFYRATDADKSRKYYAGKGIDTLSQAGRINVRPNTSNITPGGSMKGAMCPAGHTIAPNSHCYVSHDPTENMHTIDSTGTDTNNGAHGSGTPNQWGMCSDGVNVYIAGSTRITKWNGTSFSSSSATTNAGALAYLNNALYSCDGSTLKSYDGTGTATTAFTWKDATATALTALGVAPKIIPFGGVLLIYFPLLVTGPELWLYDGFGCKRVAVLPDSMIGYDIEVVNGIVFLSGLIYSSVSGSNLGAVPIAYYWANGTIGELWRSSTSVGGVLPTLNSIYHPSLGNFSGKLIISNQVDNSIYEIDPATGAQTIIKTWTVSGAYGTPVQCISSGPSSFLAVTDLGNTGGAIKFSFYPSTGTFQSGELTSSLMDFDNSLTKVFRGIKVDWAQGGTVDIYYGIDSNTAGTLLRTAAVSGTEYLLPDNTTGHTICYRVVLNVGAGVPVVKRVYVRAGPQLQSFRVRTYNLDLTASPDTPTVLQDSTLQPLMGHEQATNLLASITAAAPVTVTDRFGTYTAVLEPDQCRVLELHSDGGDNTPANSGQFVASVLAREV